MPDGDTARLEKIIRDLVEALRPFAHHSLGGWDSRSDRQYRIRVTEGQVARAGILLMTLEDQGVIKRVRDA